MWTGNYKEFLEDKVSKGEIKDYKEYHTDNTVHFTIQASQESLDALMASPAFYKNYKLITTKYTSNMMLFSPTGKLRHYANVGEIMEDFYVTRVDHYEKRKNRLLAELGDDLKWATNKSRFIQAVIDDSLVVMKRKRNQVVDDLAAAQYDKKDDSYDYLLNMPIHTLTKEKVSSLASEVVAIEKRIDSIQRTSKEQM
jgi:DNA topoisomerase-2